ncbi:MAG: metallophosphoesterase family protein [Deltaproteobacteria bacterium]|nr:metallophosphoesterase family protein [Deltaproteobacteria bacterium]MBW2041676.1 metallophosphoesterase family protein [Deltaproteobacteria bacterium]
MKYAVLSDIHANLDALEQVLSDIQAEKVDRIINLGDMIGYGAQPEEVIGEIRRHDIQTLLGNHELAVVDPDYLDWFNPAARKSLLYTADMIRHPPVRFIRSLRPFLCIDDCRFVHGYPPDSPLTYLFQADEKMLRKTFLDLDFRVCFVGHTHHLEIISSGLEGLHRAPLKKGKTRLHRTHRYILNIGSVGQPRDGNKDAKYILWDDDENSVDLKFVPYDFTAAAEKIRVAGLPEAHAKRLLPG